MGFNAGEAALSLSKNSDEEFVKKALSSLALAYPAWVKMLSTLHQSERAEAKLRDPLLILYYEKALT